MSDVEMMVPYAVLAFGGLFLAGIAWAGIATGQAEERARQRPVTPLERE